MGGKGLYRLLGVDWWIGEKDECLSVGVLDWRAAIKENTRGDGGEDPSSRCWIEVSWL